MSKILTRIDRYVPAKSVLNSTEGSVNAIQKLYQQSLIFRDWIIRHAEEGESIIIDAAMSDISENPVQNKVISIALDDKINNTDFLSYWNVNQIIHSAFGF